MLGNCSTASLHPYYNLTFSTIKYFSGSEEKEFYAKDNAHARKIHEGLAWRLTKLFKQALN